MIGGMIGLILINGLGFFWPRPVAQGHADGTAPCCSANSSTASRFRRPGRRTSPRRFRVQLKRAIGTSPARTTGGSTSPRLRRRSTRPIVLYVERREYGPFIGRATRLMDGDREVASGVARVGRGTAAPGRPGGARPIAHPGPRTGRDRRGQCGARARAAATAGAGSGLSQHGGDARRSRDGRDRAAQPAPVAGALRSARTPAVARDRRRPRRCESRCRRPMARRRQLPTIDLFRVYAPNRAVDRWRGHESTRAGCGSSSPPTRASRTPRAASSRRSSAR